MTTQYTAADDEYGDLLATFDDTDEGGHTEFYHQFDAQASTNALIEDSGSVAQQFKYQAFGLPAGNAHMGWDTLTAGEWSALTVDAWAALPASAPAGGVNHGFAGQPGGYLDADLQLYIFGMGGGTGRFYGPAIGRFLSEDWVRHSGATLDLNLFEYVGNNPVVKIDPSGTTSAAEMLFIGPPVAPPSAPSPSPRLSTPSADLGTSHLPITVHTMMGPPTLAQMEAIIPAVDREDEPPERHTFSIMDRNDLKKADAFYTATGVVVHWFGGHDEWDDLMMSTDGLVRNEEDQLRRLGFTGPLGPGSLRRVVVPVKGSDAYVEYLTNGQTSVFRMPVGAATWGRGSITVGYIYCNNKQAVANQLNYNMRVIVEAAKAALSISFIAGGAGMTSASGMKGGGPLAPRMKLPNRGGGPRDNVNPLEEPAGAPARTTEETGSPSEGTGRAPEERANSPSEESGGTAKETPPTKSSVTVAASSHPRITTKNPLVDQVANGANSETVIPNETVIVRGGAKYTYKPGNVISAQMGATAKEAASGFNYGTIRSTTAGEIRAAGGTVKLVPEPAWEGGPANTWHVDVTEGPKPAFPEEGVPSPVPKAERLARPEDKK